jgi:cell division protein FtsB
MSAAERRAANRTVTVDAPEADVSGTRGWLRGLRFSWFSFVMLGLLVLGVLVIAPTLKIYLQQQQQISDLSKANNEQSTKINALDKAKARWSDPSYIRAQARDRLLYVMPGETAYLIIDDRPQSQKNADKQTVSTTIQKTKTDWMGSLLSSVMSAGLSDQTAKQLTAPQTSTPTPTPTPSK